jgi:prevent-host-death family protein
VAEVTIRDLRNNGGDVIARVERGETLTVTRDGRPVAELRPLGRRALSSAELLRRAHSLPHTEPVGWRRDLDDAVDPAL